MLYREVPYLTTCNLNQNKISDSASEKEPKAAGIYFKDFASTKGYLFLYRQLCRNPFKCPFLSSAEQKERGFMSIDWPMGHLTNNRLKQTKSNQGGEGILSFFLPFGESFLGEHCRLRTILKFLEILERPVYFLKVGTYIQ